jgi:hypothetical protein
MTYFQPIITSDAGTFSPLMRISAEETTASRNVIHELLGGGVAVTFGENALSTSTLEMVFTSEASCLDAYTQLKTGHIFELTDYDKTSTSMFFVVSGTIDREFIIESNDTWTLNVDVQQVEP